jgi:hypothetical protein
MRAAKSGTSPEFVMPGLVPGIHDLKQSHWKKNVDGRDKPGHDEFVRRLSVLTND